MSTKAVTVSCPHCRRVYTLSIDVEKLSRLRTRAKCARCSRSFDIYSRVQGIESRGISEVVGPNAIRHPDAMDDRDTLARVQPTTVVADSSPDSAAEPTGGLIEKVRSIGHRDNDDAGSAAPTAVASAAPDSVITAVDDVPVGDNDVVSDADVVGDTPAQMAAQAYLPPPAPRTHVVDEEDVVEAGRELNALTQVVAAPQPTPEADRMSATLPEAAPQALIEDAPTTPTEPVPNRPPPLTWVELADVSLDDLPSAQNESVTALARLLGAA